MSPGVSRVYSTRIWEGRNVNVLSYTVPSGYRLVLRDIDTFFGGGIGGGAANYVGTLGQTFAYASFTGLISELVSWRGRQVFEPGETIRMVSGPGVDVTASGYLLELP